MYQALHQAALRGRTNAITRYHVASLVRLGTVASDWRKRDRIEVQAKLKPPTPNDVLKFFNLELWVSSPAVLFSFERCLRGIPAS